MGLGDKLNSLLGARTAKLLEQKLQLVTVSDLLRHYPRKYNRRGELTDMRFLVEGERATIVAKVTGVKVRESQRKNVPGPKGRLHVLILTISDGTMHIECSFFNQRHRMKDFTIGTSAIFSGKVSRFRDTVQMSSAHAETMASTHDGAGVDHIAELAGVTEAIEDFGNGITPMYPLAEGVSLWVIQKSVKLVLDQLDSVVDPLPTSLLAHRGYTDLATALRHIHRPVDEKTLENAITRLRFDEALAMQLVLAQRRARIKSYPAEPCPPRAGGLLAAFDARLPFELTHGQQEVGRAISDDLSTLHPMNRLLQGEVGSGKTVVALRAMLQVIDNGRQTVLMAPTEVLATQHARSVREVLGRLASGGELGAPDGATKVTLLTGSLGAAARKQALLDIASGQAGIAIGTHALLGKHVMFANLGLVVVDEQHRFGVEQRDQLRGTNPETSPPHVLVMTATPIPRTVAMTVYGDLETSVLRELPKGRTPIVTNMVPAHAKPHWLERVWERVREEVAQGRQVYVVCPRIGDVGPDGPDTLSGFDSFDGSEPGMYEGADDDGKRQAVAVVDALTELSAGPLAGLKLATLHGRLNANDKDDTMTAFKQGQIDVLVATTVIEVGVDVPNATMMVILDADRFGMSQLHQLRGRVGRGGHAGYCFLVTQAPEGSPSLQRLSAVAATLDGFELAKADLALRREGDILGRIQAGRSSSLKLLSLLRDEEIILMAREDAIKFVADEEDLKRWPGLAEMANALIAEVTQDFLEKG
ncbi:ATP-dependent DNA helicase RecG [Nakamurella antarctica]|uniref:Probable DNA 3'-5' helicase RecG n=1 Tax=Nakamurella antarctica TaxID=1902245 RepID=A0A3G8ZQI7_9ACTN|nr:ATP-dependent DNA helicase RecG [Nakamurella antarctica]